jgi:hypothetical protein
MDKISTILKFFIDKGFGNFDVFAKSSLFSGFSKALNRGIFFHSTKIEKMNISNILDIQYSVRNNACLWLQNACPLHVE